MKSIVDAIDHPDWVLKGWQIKFVLSERVLHEIKLLSRLDHWYDDPVVAATWREGLRVCFVSIINFQASFSVLPQPGDRLFDEDSGLLIVDRSVDGQLKVITFTLTI